jgi:small-conductance mechanosensitive channel
MIHDHPLERELATATDKVRALTAENRRLKERQKQLKQRNDELMEVIRRLENPL